MKLRAITFLFVLLLLGCAGDPKSVDNCPPPSDIPTWVKWDCELYDAYREGRLYFNEDSTAYGIGSREKLTPSERAKADSLIQNGQYQVKQ